MRYLPGVWFDPTDQQIVSHYLNDAGELPAEARNVILEVNVYESEPNALPVQTAMDAHWQYYLHLQKSDTTMRIHRVTRLGFWKSTGKDVRISIGGQVAGKRKTLVYYLRCGKSTSKRTDWIMYEYSLEGSSRRGSFVLCKVRNKGKKETESVSVMEEITDEGSEVTFCDEYFTLQSSGDTAATVLMSSNERESFPASVDCLSSFPLTEFCLSMDSDCAMASTPQATLPVASTHSFQDEEEYLNDLSSDLHDLIKGSDPFADNFLEADESLFASDVNIPNEDSYYLLDNQLYYI